MVHSGDYFGGVFCSKHNGRVGSGPLGFTILNWHLGLVGAKRLFAYVCLHMFDFEVLHGSSALARSPGSHHFYKMKA